MVTKNDTAATPASRPALAADDPRAVRYREEYEERMARVNSERDQDAEARAEAKGAYDGATANFEVAKADLETAQEQFAKAQAEQLRLSQAYARFGSPAFVQPTPAETLAPGEDTVLMVFPTNVTLQVTARRADDTIIGTRSATFHEGIQEVPVSLQNHQYLIDHNVMPYGGPRIDRQAAVRKEETKAA